MTKTDTKPAKNSVDLFDIDEAEVKALKVGDLVENQIGKFRGIATVEINWANGTRRFTVQGMNKDGTENKGWTVDDVQLKLIKAAPVDRTPKVSGKFVLGDHIRDLTVPSWVGHITGIYQNLNGCVQYEIAGEDKAAGHRVHLLLHESEIEHTGAMHLPAPEVTRRGSVHSSPVAR